MAEKVARKALGREVNTENFPVGEENFPID